MDVNAHACAATRETVHRAVADVYPPNNNSNGDVEGATIFLGAVRGDLTAPLRDRSVDVLVFNPPYVPTDELPSLSRRESKGEGKGKGSYEEDSHLLELSYAGGRDGMETTDRLLESLPRVLSGRGCAYVLLCAQNRPAEVKERAKREGWEVETVGSSGKRAGWERLQVIRIWRRDLE